MDKGFTNDAIPALSVVESPIEGRFVQAFVNKGISMGLCPKYTSSSTFGAKLTVVFAASGKIRADAILHIQPKPSFMNGKRLDFILTYAIGGSSASIGVELDGKAFHSSDAQMLSDRKRDRLALLNGIPIVRYTGSEVFSSADDVVNEAMNIAASRRSGYMGSASQ